MALPPGTQDEMALVERVFLRIGSAETDEQLENALSKFLPPVLLKLSSTQDGVRKKVMELLVHVNKRVRSSAAVRLPVETLVLQYQDPAATSFLKNFTIIYIKLGFPRLEPSKQMELAVPLLLSIENSPQSHQDSVLSLVTGVIGSADFKDKRANADIAELKERPVVLKMLLDFMLDLLLLPYGVTWPPPPASDGSAVPPPAGLSERTVRRALGEQPLPADRLEALKAGLVRFLAQVQLPAVTVAPQLLVAMADTRFTVANQADMALKRLSDLDWNDATLVGKLCEIYLGTVVPKNKPNLAPKPELRRTPVNTRIRLKLLPYLSRSRTAATMFPQSVQLMFDSLYGTNTNPKLKLLALQFTTLVIQEGSESRLAPLGAMVLGVLHGILVEERSDTRLRSAAYTAIGRLGQKLPALITRDLSIIKVFFVALDKEEAETAQFVQDTLQLLAPSLRQLDEAQQTVIEALLTSCMERQSGRSRHMAVQYAAVVFPESHVGSRLHLLLATGDSDEDVASEALKHLRLTVSDASRSDSVRQLPQFTDMVACVTNKASERQVKKQAFSVGSSSLPFPSKAFATIIRYLSLCLQRQTSPTAPLRHELVRGRTAGLAAALASPQLAAAVQTYLTLAMRLLHADVTEMPLFCLLEAVAAAPDTLAPLLADELDWIRSMVSYLREPVRLYAAELFAVVAAASLDDQRFSLALNQIHQLATSKVPEQQHGGLMALAHCLSRRARAGRPPARDDQHAVQLGTDLMAQLESSQTQLLSVCLLGVSELGRTGRLPVSAGPASQRCPPSQHYVISRLLTVATNKKATSQIRERAIVACGCVCVGDAALPFRQDIAQHFLAASSELDDLEIQMAVGEALVCVVLGPLSSEARDPWLAGADDSVRTPLVVTTEYQPDELLHWLLRQLLENQVTQTHPNTRQCAAVWLLAMVKYCQNLQPLRQALPLIQAAFMELLASTKDLVQEAACRGLVLVYDSGDEQQRTQLVERLMAALTGPAATVQLSSGHGAAAGGAQPGSDPSGGQLSAYRQLCSLACDLNQPELIYQLMTLVDYNSAWKSSRGTALGFSSSAARTAEALAPHLGTIVPKLYRYQFDPRPQMQQTMRSIWSVIVPETSKTVALYLPQITAEVLTQLTHVAWRVREACCSALSELLTSGGLQSVLHLLADMWTTLFRVRDDIKESVRLAAGKTLDVLSRVSVRLCEQQDSPKSSQKALELVLPVLLEKGLTSTVTEVRVVSLTTLTQLARCAGPRLRPHLGVLVPALLEALSTLESNAARYISTAVGHQADTQELVDRRRLSAAKDSAMFRTLTQCIQYVDCEEAAVIVPRLSELVKRNTGLATKCGVVLFAARLASERPLAVQHSSGKILSTLVHGMQDRNVTVRRCSASSCGAVCRVARPASVEKLIAKLRAWYTEAEDETLRPVCALALHSLSQNSPSQLKEHAAAAASLAFFAMHREKTPETEAELTLWQEVWTELAPGTEGGLRLYLSDIVSLCVSQLAGLSWPAKAQAAAVLGAAARHAGGLDAAQLQPVLDALLTALPGRTWDGKQALLTALADVCENCASAVAQPDVLADAVLHEAGRQRLDYKTHAVAAAGRVLDHLRLDRFAALFELVATHLQSGPKGGVGGSDDDDTDGSARLQLQEAAYTALGRAWPDNTDTQALFWPRYVAALAAAMPRCTRSHQLTIVTSLRPVTARLWLLKTPCPERDRAVLVETADQLGSILALALEMPKYPSLRREALEVAQAVLNSVGDLRTKLQFPVLPTVGVLRVRLTAGLEAARADPNHDVQAAAGVATGLLDNLAQ